MSAVSTGIAKPPSCTPKPCEQLQRSPWEWHQGAEKSQTSAVALNFRGFVHPRFQALELLVAGQRAWMAAYLFLSSAQPAPSPRLACFNCIICQKIIWIWGLFLTRRGSLHPIWFWIYHPANAFWNSCSTEILTSLVPSSAFQGSLCSSVFVSHFWWCLTTLSVCWTGVRPSNCVRPA